MTGPQRNLAFLSLGSNIAPERNLPAATGLLAEAGSIRSVSQAWQSPPYGFAEQDDFVNAAVLLETSLSARGIIERLIPKVEQHLGRRRDPSNKNGPRTIDVDLSLYNREVGEFSGKLLPDPAILERLFVSWPLAELDPDYCHPVAGRTLREIADLQARSVNENRIRDDRNSGALSKSVSLASGVAGLVCRADIRLVPSSGIGK
jgi:2-amino-4-hydroxy-6-hydroxymethyldihydropteridine diphosphokinase